MDVIILAIMALLGLYMAWNIGANDVANSMADAVGSGALSVKQAVIAAGICEFAGAVLRPHASLMGRGEKLTPDGQIVLDAARQAGHDLIEQGYFGQGTLDEISRPLISQEEYRKRLNQAL